MNTFAALMSRWSAAIKLQPLLQTHPLPLLLPLHQKKLLHRLFNSHHLAACRHQILRQRRTRQRATWLLKPWQHSSNQHLRRNKLRKRLRFQCSLLQYRLR